MRKRGTVKFYTADRICTELGVHMAQVYGWAEYMDMCWYMEERSEKNRKR